MLNIENIENNENLEVVELDTEDLEDVSGGKKANQKVKATGDVYVRSKANKEASKIGLLTKGDKVSFLGSIKTDSRGVDWYKVNYNGNIGWVSSKYSKIV